VLLHILGPYIKKIKERKRRKYKKKIFVENKKNISEKSIPECP
jgi:hypothetical protein